MAMKASPIISINYIVPIKGVWKGKAQFVSEGGVGIYDGNWKDGLPHGHGKFENNEYMYEGEFTNGDRHGIGNENTIPLPVGKPFSLNVPSKKECSSLLLCL